MAAHCVQRYGNTPGVLVGGEVPLFGPPGRRWVGRHGVAPPSDRSIAMMALMPSTQLTSTASLPTLMASSPLVTPHGPPGVGHDCGKARNVTDPVATPPLNESHDTAGLVALQREAALQAGAAHLHLLARADIHQRDIRNRAGRVGAQRQPGGHRAAGGVGKLQRGERLGPECWPERRASSRLQTIGIRIVLHVTTPYGERCAARARRLEGAGGLRHKVDAPGGDRSTLDARGRRSCGGSCQ